MPLVAPPLPPQQEMQQQFEYVIILSSAYIRIKNVNTNRPNFCAPHDFSITATILVRHYLVIINIIRTSLISTPLSLAHDRIIKILIRKDSILWFSSPSRHYLAINCVIIACI